VVKLEVTVNQLIKVLKGIENSYSNWRESVAKLIATNIESLDGVNTYNHLNILAKWNAMFDGIKTGTIKVNKTDVTDSSFNTKHLIRGDDKRMTSMLTSTHQGDSAALTDVTVSRKKKFVMGKSGAFLVDNKHDVDYVICHVYGYKKYTYNSKIIVYVRGRDIIIAATLLSVEDGIDMMKDEIETLIKKYAK